MSEPIAPPAQPSAHHPAPTGESSHGSTGQAHPIGLYLKIWGMLFVLSAMSYAVDYFHLQGALRWTLILVFMAAKAGLIVAVFMHMAWERLALVYAILLPPLCLLVLVWLMAVEADYTFVMRGVFFR